MKKLAIAIGAPALILSGAAQADTVVGLYAGAQVWDTSNSGQFGTGNGNQSFAFTGHRCGIPVTVGSLVQVTATKASHLPTKSKRVFILQLSIQFHFCRILKFARTNWLVTELPR